MNHLRNDPKHEPLSFRRSKRVPAQLPVLVQGESADRSSFEDPTRAIILSAHGCLLTLSAAVRLGQKVVLRNVSNHHWQDCRVVYVGDKQGGRTEVGLRFKSPSPNFWGLDNPPTDWNKP
jgi:hypothetical protein